MICRIVLVTVLCTPLSVAQGQGGGCLSQTKSDIGQDAAGMVKAVVRAPRVVLQPHNLKWELPIAAATAVFITSVDGHTVGLVTSPAVASDSRKASNAAFGAEILLGAVPYVAGCAGGREHARRAGFAALEGMGYALGTAAVLKEAFNRQSPTSRNSEGDFWEGGKSFPSGHAMGTWGLASALAHKYPQNRPLKWAAYGLAVTTSLLRIPARKHFPSDILVGGTLGYLIGSEIGTR
jgi:membrane-associated phospholipid phosphatase